MPHMRFFIDSPLDEPMAKIEGEEFLHLKKVMRAQVGMEIELINGAGALAYGTIDQLDKRVALIKISEKKEEAPPPLQTILYQSMPKFTHLQLIVEKCTELGVDEIVLFDSQRSEKKGLSTNQKGRLRHILIASIKQCGRLHLPTIYEDSLESCMGRGALFYGDVEGAQKLISAETNSIFINGPEGGFTAKEIAKLEKLGAQGITLGTHTLRCETAAIAATTLIRYSLP